MRNFGLVDSVEAFEALVDSLDPAKDVIGFDIETGYVGQDRLKGSVHVEDPDSMVVGFSFTNDPRWAKYVPLAHDTGPNLDPVRIAPIVWRLLSTFRWTAHNAGFEQKFMRKFFKTFLPESVWAPTDGWTYPYSDTMVMSYLLADHPRHALKFLTKAVLGEDQAEIDTLFPKLTQKQLSMLRFNVLEVTPEVVNYACDDSAYCLELHYQFHPRASVHPLYQLETQVTQVLLRMEDFGVRYDWDAMNAAKAAGDQFLPRIRDDLMAEFSALAGEPIDINLGSPPQLAGVLYGKIGMPVVRYTKPKNDTPRKPSTDRLAMQALAVNWPVIHRLRAYKGLAKLISSYLATYPSRYAYAPDGMTHPNHLQCVVPSGRFAVDSPPYQQSPKKYHYDLAEAVAAHEAGTEPPPGTCFQINFRRFITAPPDHYVLGFDYSQVELRVLAGVSGEPGLLDAFNNDVDVHKATASLMFGVDMNDVSDELRSRGKTLNFGMVYGLEVSGLAERLNITKEQAKELYDQYFATFSSIKSWTQKQVAEGYKNGFVMTPFGRKVVIRELFDSRRFVREHGERLCYNAPVQGGAADYMKVAMVRCDAKLRATGMDAKVHTALNIHDALEFYVHNSVPPAEVIRLLDPEVSFKVDFLPTIRADWHFGPTWGDLTEVSMSADGTLVIKGGKTLEDDFMVDPEEEDTGSSPEPVAMVRTAPLPQDGPEWLVTLPETPSQEEFAGLVEWLTGHPGPGRYDLVTPVGTVSATADLSMGHAIEIAMLVPGATLTKAPGYVTASDLFAVA